MSPPHSAIPSLDTRLRPRHWRPDGGTPSSGTGPFRCIIEQRNMPELSRACVTRYPIWHAACQPRTEIGLQVRYYPRRVRVGPRIGPFSRALQLSPGTIRCGHMHELLLANCNPATLMSLQQLCLMACAVLGRGVGGTERHLQSPSRVTTRIQIALASTDLLHSFLQPVQVPCSHIPR